MNTLSSFFSAAPLALGLTLSGCSAKPVCGDGNWDLATDKNPCMTGGTGGSAGAGGTGGTGGVGGNGGTGGTGGGGLLIPGAQYVPQPANPLSGATLPPTRALISWKAPAAVPTGRTFSAFQTCQTSGPVTDIDDDSECPNSAMPVVPFVVIDPLAEDSKTNWKVRALYKSGEFSAWSPLQDFMTDHSLAAWWRLNGDAKDSGTASINGTLQNGVGFGQGIDNQALACDGVDDHADMGSSLNIPGAVTLSAWIFGNGVPTSADSGIVVKGALNYALTYHTNGRVYFYIGQGGNNVNAAVAPNVWSHVVGSFDGTTSAGSLKLFVNGVLAASKTSGTASTGASGSLFVGRYNASYFKGSIDNVTVYDGALSDIAVLNEYCATQAAGGTALPAACN